jgi:hypothetical protein
VRPGDPPPPKKNNNSPHAPAAADDYNLGQVLNVSLQFFEAQRSGRLPRVSNVPWRGNSALFDSVIVPGTSRNVSLIGGWCARPLMRARAVGIALSACVITRLRRTSSPNSTAAATCRHHHGAGCDRATAAAHTHTHMRVHTLHAACRYDDGGMLKVTYSTAFTVSLLSWAFAQFKAGYRSTGNAEFGANTIRCARVCWRARAAARVHDGHLARWRTPSWVGGAGPRTHGRPHTHNGRACTIAH